MQKLNFYFYVFLFNVAVIKTVDHQTLQYISLGGKYNILAILPFEQKS